MSDPSTRITTDHEKIRLWAESRGARPAKVEGTGDAEDPGVLRLRMPQRTSTEQAIENLEEIPWDDWLAKFEEQELALVYQEQTADGEPSNFNKLVQRAETG